MDHGQDPGRVDHKQEGETKLLEMSDGPRQFVLGPLYKVKPAADFFAEAKALLGEAALL